MMSPEQEPLEKRQSLANLAVEILSDSQKLFEQQLALTKLQLIEDWATAKPSLLWLVIGLIALCGASVLTAYTLAYLLHEISELRLWVSFAIVDLVFLLVAAVSLYVARAKLKGLSVLNGK